MAPEIVDAQGVLSTVALICCLSGKGYMSRVHSHESRSEENHQTVKEEGVQAPCCFLSCYLMFNWNNIYNIYIIYYINNIYIIWQVNEDVLAVIYLSLYLLLVVSERFCICSSDVPTVSIVLTVINFSCVVCNCYICLCCWMQSSSDNCVLI